jgi:hypothetical protein
MSIENPPARWCTVRPAAGADRSNQSTWLLEKARLGSDTCHENSYFCRSPRIVRNGLALAANPACGTQAAEKKLAGAAKTSLVKKCEKDATEAATNNCNTQAADKKLAGAAKTSFVKKCVKDTTETK